MVAIVRFYLNDEGWIVEPGFILLYGLIYCVLVLCER